MVSDADKILFFHFVKGAINADPRPTVFMEMLAAEIERLERGDKKK